MPVCKDCGEDKELDQFWKAKKNTISKIWGKCKTCMAKKRKTNKWGDSLGVRYSHYRNHNRRQNRIGQVFDLSKEQFDAITKQTCHYCGLYSADKPYSGIDRVDDTIGYTLLNCVPCCAICNFMKRFMSVSDFLAHIARIYTRSVTMSV